MKPRQKKLLFKAPRRRASAESHSLGCFSLAPCTSLLEISKAFRLERAALTWVGRINPRRDHGSCLTLWVP